MRIDREFWRSLLLAIGDVDARASTKAVRLRSVDHFARLLFGLVEQKRHKEL